MCFQFTSTYRGWAEWEAERQGCLTVDTALRLADAATQVHTGIETRSETVQLQQCINSRHFSFLWQTHWPVPKADGGEMTAVNYSGMLLIWKSVLPWKHLYFLRVFGSVMLVLRKGFWVSSCQQFWGMRRKENQANAAVFCKLLAWWQQSEGSQLCACIWEVFISAFPFNPLNIALSKAEYESETCYKTKCPRSSERVCSLKISDYKLKV